MGRWGLFRFSVPLLLTGHEPPLETITTSGIKLKGLDFTEGAKVQKLDLVNNPDRVGDVTGAFEPAEAFKPLAPDSE